MVMKQKKAVQVASKEKLLTVNLQGTQISLAGIIFLPFWKLH